MELPREKQPPSNKSYTAFLNDVIEGEKFSFITTKRVFLSDKEITQIADGGGLLFPVNICVFSGWKIYRFFELINFFFKVKAVNLPSSFFIIHKKELKIRTRKVKKIWEIATVYPPPPFEKRKKVIRLHRLRSKEK